MAAMRQSRSQSRSQSRPQAWSGWATRWIPVVLVLALLASGFAAYQYDLGDRWFGGSTTPPSPDPDTEPAAVPPPAGVSLPLPAQPAPVAQAVAEVVLVGREAAREQGEDEDDRDPPGRPPRP